MVTALKISQYVNIVVRRYCFVSGAVFQNLQTVSILVIDQLLEFTSWLVVLSNET